MHDFDWAMVYGSLHWGSAEPGSDTLGPAPQAAPKFKWIGVTGQVLRHPDWSDERQVADLRRQIDCALELGYDVLVVRLWDIDLDQLETATGMVADSSRLAARYAACCTATTSPPRPSPIPSPARCTASSAGRVARPKRPARRQSVCVASSCGTDRHRGPPGAWCNDCPRTRSSRIASETGR
jgi:hypothetical protein